MRERENHEQVFGEPTQPCGECVLVARYCKLLRRFAHGYKSGMPAVLPLARAAARSSTRRRSSTPRKRREAPSIPASGRNVACKSPDVRRYVELLMTLRRDVFATR